MNCLNFFCYFLVVTFMGVELRGVEPLSKHIRQKLSTCLSNYCLSGTGRELANQSAPYLR